MISELELINYRGFSRHKIPFRELSIVVGRNNAGKSTIIEALTIVSIIVSRAAGLRYQPTPDWLDEPSGTIGVSPSLRGLDFEYRNLGYRYQDTPATIIAKLNDNSSVRVHLHPVEAEIFATLRDKDGHLITSPSDARSIAQNEINVLPPIGGFGKSERVLSEDYVRANLGSILAPLHFRNQLHYFGNSPATAREGDDMGYEGSVTRFESFSRLAESSWPKLRVVDLETSRDREREIRLLVRDGPFVSEVGWVGHGLQAWLQVCWFLARCSQRASIILDEPDVFLHADLQRKLLRLVKGYFPQIIIATHSVEIMSEVDPECILIVDKDSRRSSFAERIPAVQEVLANIGSANNLQLTRLWAARRCLFVEGRDLEFLNAFHEIVFPESETALSALPNISIGGFGNWRLALGAAIGLREAGDEAIKSYCILDSDYRTSVEHDDIKETAKQKGLNIHIWSRKEIENYLLEPVVLARFIGSRASEEGPHIEDVRKKIEDICNEFKDDVFDQISQEYQRIHRTNLSTANKATRDIVEDRWGTADGKISLVSGKKVMSALSGWSKNTYDVSFSAMSIAREMVQDEINSEVAQVISAIEKSREFS